MSVAAIIEWALFLALAAVALSGAAMMLLTMSMYRAGLFLMVSFLALAGLFFLLDAELLAVIQIMMNAGAMLVMIVFMVMLMMDPGGEMMWEMKRQMRLPGLGAFSMSMPRRKPPMPEAVGAAPRTAEPGVAGDVARSGDASRRSGFDTTMSKSETTATRDAEYSCPMHPEVRSTAPGGCPKCGMDLVPAGAVGRDSNAGNGFVELDQGAGADAAATGPIEGHAHGHDRPASPAPAMSPAAHHRMMVDMAMSTEQLPWALVIGLLSSAGLTVLALVTPWTVAPRGAVTEASAAVGELLLSRYMMVFEGAAMLILAGIASGVILGRREQRVSTTTGSDGQALEEQDRITQPHDNGETTMHQSRDAKAPQGAKEVWTCPMHREIRESKPGQCPKCGMNLVPESSLGGSTGPGSHGTGSSGGR